MLLIDDNIDVAESLATWLKLAGQEVETAVNGWDGIKTAASFKPDIILLDIGLPDLDGYQVAQKLRELPNISNTMIIALSGNAPRQNEMRNKTLGFDHYLIKPPKISQLHELIAGYRK